MLSVQRSLKQLGLFLGHFGFLGSFGVFGFGFFPPDFLLVLGALGYLGGVSLPDLGSLTDLEPLARVTFVSFKSNTMDIDPRNKL